MMSQIQRVPLLWFWILLVAGVFGGLSAKDLSVKPGHFAYFGVEFPSALRAGEKAQLKLIPFDAYGNKTNFFGERERKFRLVATGSVQMEKNIFSSADLSETGEVITFSDRVAEEATFFIMEGDVLVLLKNMATGNFATSEYLQIDHAGLNGFEVQLPQNAVAGEEFEIHLIAQDAYGNTVTEYANIAEGVSVTVAGQSRKESLSVPAHLFADGRAVLSLRYDLPEEVVVKVAESSNPDISGSSKPLALGAQVASRFEVNAPESIRAGEKFKISVNVYNQFGRLMKNYGAVGQDIVLTTNGSGVLMPNKIPSSRFQGGSAVLEAIYTKSEPILITAVLSGKKSAQEPPKAGLSAKPESSAPAPVVSEVGNNAKKSPKELFGETEQEYSGLKGADFFPLSLHFPQGLGQIVKAKMRREQIKTKSRIAVDLQFSNATSLVKIKKMEKEIMIAGEMVGKLFVDGNLDKNGVMTVYIEELKPLHVDIAVRATTLELRLKPER